MRGCWWILAVATTACASEATTSDPAAPATTATATTTTATATTTSPTTTTSPVPVPVSVEASIGIGGGEALGLAIGSDSVWAVSFESSSLAAVDPVTNQVTASVDVPAGSATAIAVDSEIWVAAYAMSGGSSLTRVDPTTAVIADTFPTDELCCDLSSGDGAVWAIEPGGAALQFDVAGGALIDRFAIEVDRNVHVNGVYSNGTYWFASDNGPLSRLDPASGTISTFDVGGGVPFLGRDGLLWGASTDGIWGVDDATGDVVERVTVPESIEVMSLEVTDRDLFVGMRHPGRRGAVLQLDRRTGALAAELPVDIPARMSLGFGSLWVTDSGSDLLYRIGPVTT